MNKDEIRELLIKSMHSNKESRHFFKANFNNKEILEVLFEIALDKSENY